MSKFLYHEGCPSCGSSDNVGVWEDGHKWCFGCGWQQQRNKVMSIDNLKTKIIKGEPKDAYRVSLPFDFSYNIPPVALAWLRTYGITDEEINRERIGWSDSKQYLVFPVFDNFDHLLLWQGRYFGSNEAFPKYFTSGTPETVLAIVGPEGRYDFSHDLDGMCRNLVLVEDYISAIKVGRRFPTLCLFGSEISLTRIRELSDRVIRLIIWLDRDKLRSAIKARFKALAYFKDVNVVVSKFDPKEYNDDETRRFITRSQADDLGFSC